MRKIYLFTFMILLLAHLKGQAQQITLHVEPAGTLPRMIDESRFPYITDLKLTGELNGTDIKHIREMILSKLKVLDLSEARIVSGGGPYAQYYTQYYYTDNDIIGHYMFGYYKELPVISKIILPKSTLEIGKEAFRNCTSLTDINIPNAVTSIGKEAFMYCTSLTDINIPNSVTSIGKSAFYDCTSLTDINIPNSVTRIGYSVFCNCTSLTDINIPNAVTSIGTYAFCNCKSLTDINIPNSVTSIGTQAFSGCKSLTDINIPNSVTSIGEYVFYECDNLKSVYMNSSTPPYSDVQASSKDLTIYIPRGSYTAYWLSCWGNYNLVEYDPTDIQGVTTSAYNGAEKYFSIDGRPFPVHAKE